MTDVVSPEERSRIMRAVRSRDTAPERVVLEIVRSLRFRPTLHGADLPGTPDLVFPRRRKVIFVHGCFWHRHACDAGRSFPSSNVDFWSRKFDRNQRRDRRVRRKLRALGWKSLVVWSCQTTASRRDTLRKRITTFLRDG